MSTESSRSNPPLQTVLPINFIIIGGGLAGLACAIALKRVGHHAVVLERGTRTSVASDTGIRMPPNCTKVLFHWGLRAKLLEKSLVTHTLLFTRYETGEYLGSHVWDQGIMKETRGLYLLTTHAAVYEVLYDAAIAAGIEVRFAAEVTEISRTSPAVTLSTGETLSADVIVGADGEFGLARKVVAGDRAKGTRVGKAIYDSQFPTSVLEEYGAHLSKENGIVSSMGDELAIVAYPIHGGKDYACQWYGPDDGPDGHYGDPAVSNVNSLAEPEHQTLRWVLPTVKPAVRLSVRQHEDLDEWISHEPRLVLVGEAAHPFPPSTIQANAMAIEDGAVLAKLFSHLQEKRQIVNFLYAFQDVRQARVNHVRAQEYSVLYMMILGGDAAEVRNAAMKAKAAEGKNVLAGDDSNATKQWEEMSVIFGYDCEDQADDWWVKWGILRERALSVDAKTPGPGDLDFSKIVRVRSTTVDACPSAAAGNAQTPPRADANAE
ncbi:FAD/NAD-P-binding domain-containing protein [Trametes versicolor FP-101664 SS1]|uniref:FAD/NAD-P-binding domain-containing protein n=1 Tax=Trametes versicolor (strain FP-101664) TaxID=717944 RepID=UPI0004621644|nr:FAD/NAD-P-binding domain-containing protein [Trametes versicolor FP-101664 SS1]EIW63927.1 FAD/NAD-P-binding domain-containing protein [Trametes versicolor FP-101664 SS1]